MRATLLTTVGLIVTSMVMAVLMVMAVDALDFEAQAMERHIAEHVARMDP